MANASVRPAALGPNARQQIDKALAPIKATLKQ
jgi:hypothetical protein